MTFTPDHLALSVLHRLRNVAEHERVDAKLIQARYVTERFLDRLARSPYRDMFVLKGAMLHVVWKGDAYRATRDLDLFGKEAADIHRLVALFKEICTIPSTDGLHFLDDKIRAEEIRENSDYGGMRVHLVAMLGKTQLLLTVDVGFGNAVEPPPRIETFPTLLGDPAIKILAYPRETAVAEKLQTVVALGEANSRFKDYYDLYVWSERFEFDGPTLARSVDATFHRRHTDVPPALPPSLTASFFANPRAAEGWRAYLGSGRLDGAPADFTAVGENLGRFANPLFQALADEEEFPRQWQRGGPWR